MIDSSEPERKQFQFYNLYGKRLFDLLMAIFAIVFGFPVILILALVIRWKLGTPILFRQQRPGLGERPFTIYKFRTMIDRRNKTGELLPDEERVTNFGQFLRSTSLDELPELLNVIKGEMSLVGPRPLLMQYLPLYTPEQARRHEVRPGITGWAQVNGRNAISWEEKFEFDVWYVNHISLLRDLKIIYWTLYKIIKRENITQPGQATMTAFRGSSEGEKEDDR